MRRKRPVPIRHVGTNPITPKASERLKPLLSLGSTGFVPMFRVFRTFLKGQGLKNTKNTIHRHLLNRMGVELKGYLRRIGKPSKRRARAALTSDALACRTGTAEGVRICLRPMVLATHSADVPPMAERTVTPGCCTPASDPGRWSRRPRRVQWVLPGKS